MKKFNFKVGDIIEGCGDVVEITEIPEGNKFSGRHIECHDIPDHETLGTIYTEWTKNYEGWKLVKKYNTPLWKALNGR